MINTSFENVDTKATFRQTVISLLQSGSDNAQYEKGLVDPRKKFKLSLSGNQKHKSDECRCCLMFTFMWFTHVKQTFLIIEDNSFYIDCYTENIMTKNLLVVSSLKVNYCSCFCRT